MKISDIADVSLGTILTRVKPTSQYDDTVEVPFISMQEVSYVSGGNIENKPEISNTVSVLSSKKNQCTYAKENEILYGLTQFRCVVATKDLIGKLVPSNLAVITVKSNEIDPGYLMWSLNEGPCSKETIFQVIQGTTFVKLVTVSSLRDLELGKLPPLDIQKKISSLYLALLSREKIEKEITDKKTSMILEVLKQINRK
jgi:hypothetical protein